MPHRITKTFGFDAAHWLPRVPEGHKCKRLHGHTYRVEIALEGDLNADLGWVADYGDISTAIKPLLECLDHHCLNEIEGLDNPTAENLAAWLFEQLTERLPCLADVTVSETPATSAVYRP